MNELVNQELALLVSVQNLKSIILVHFSFAKSSQIAILSSTAVTVESMSNPYPGGCNTIHIIFDKLGNYSPLERKSQYFE